MYGSAKSAPGLARSVRLAMVAALLCGGAGMARAQGFLELFGNAFGRGGVLPQPDWVQQDAPPLVVRPHRPRRHPSSGGAQHYDVASLKSITIYTDKTLEPGDAVMTATGLKVFNGSRSWPYTEGDFVAIASSGRTANGLRKELTAIDKASRPALRR